jgi:hypothetical protein
MTVTGCWKLAHYHGLFTGRRCSNFLQEAPQSMTVRKFAGILSSQLLALADSLKKDPTTNVPLSVVTQASTGDNEVSSPSTNTNSCRSHLSRGSSAQSFTDCNGTVYFPYPFSPSKGARCGIKPRRCSWCREEGKPNRGGWAHHSCSCCRKAYCCPSAKNNNRDCFRLHVEAIRRISRRQMQGV